MNKKHGFQLGKTREKDSNYNGGNMEQLVKWRFPSNNHTQELGINTADLETFRKDPASSFAREICQNSIDAQLDKSKPVRIEFSPFSLLTEKLPDREELLSAAVGAYSNWKGRDKSNSLDQLKTITRRLDTNQSMRLRCLRVSDFNTTGLLGVKDNDTSKPFYMLTRGSGASSKEGTSGGSKGIGKNAAFVVSKIRTVFYSTLTKSGDKGSLGIAKFGSGFMFDGQTKTYDKRTKTMGVGYYGIDDFNNPIQEQTFLDEQFSRKIDEFGTDLFIIEHSLEDNWQHLIVAKVLESFMYAIYQGKLEVNVDGIEISKLTLGERINELKILSTIKPPIKKSIVSQYLVLTAENAYELSLIHI